MTKHAKPFPIKAVAAVGFGVAVSFALLSLFLLFVQARSTIDRIVGEVVAVQEQSITIINARGQTTTLIVPDDVYLRGVDAISEVTLGQHLMIRGAFVDEATFKVEGLRVVEDRP